MKDHDLDQDALTLSIAAFSSADDAALLPEALLPFDVTQYGATGRRAQKVQRRSQRRQRQRQVEWRSRSRRA